MYVFYGQIQSCNFCVVLKGLKGERGEEGPIGLPVSVT